MISAPLIDEVRAMVCYDESTGIFTRRLESRRARCGDRAETMGSTGYPVVFVAGKTVTAARLALFLVNGVWPEGRVVALNGDKSDTRISNLREGPKGRQGALRGPLTVERLQELFDYSPASGIFVRRKSGKEAGYCTAHGYLTICIDYRDYYAHRLAWIWVHGTWPIHAIDHRDADRSNNRIQNLRDVPQAINCQNQRSAPRHSRSGILGASRDSSGRWRARLVHQGQAVHAGPFNSSAEAHETYVVMKRRFHEGCTL